MKVPRSSAASEKLFRSVLPKDSRVTVRPMFGNLAAFVNGNIFAGIYGDDIFVRLSDEGCTELLAIDGASPFAPMAGRAMKGYVNVPRAWRGEPDRVSEWTARSLGWAGELPAKKKKK